MGTAIDPATGKTIYLFPYPVDNGGDVKNLLGAPGGNDSVWIDLDYPVRQTRSGKKYKPLFAFLIVDLDGRVNLNTQGNIRGVLTNQNGVVLDQNNNPIRIHASNQGWGHDEVNLGKVLPAQNGPSANSAFEWTQLFQGNPNFLVPNVPYNGVSGRYAPGNTQGNALGVYPSYPSLTLQPPNGTPPGQQNSLPPFLTGVAPFYAPVPFYAQVDLDGVNETRGTYDGPPAGPMSVPSSTGASGATNTFTGFPTFGTGTPSQNGYGGGSIAELTRHPLLFNPIRPAAGDQTFDVKDMRRLIGRYGASGSSLDYRNTNLYRLIPNNLDGNYTPLPSPQPSPATDLGAKIRHLITLASADLGRPGVTPTLSTTGYPSGGTLYTLQTAPTTFPFAPTAAPTNTPPTVAPPAPTTASEFSGNRLPTGGLPTNADWRAFSAALGRVDLNRPLRSYIDSTANPPAVTAASYQAAVQDRQNFAKDIFDRLRFAVGAWADPASLAAGPEKDAMQWLAQLAVNIVDYIDDDDYITPFNWKNVPTASVTATDFVYGVETPKLVLNEGYAEYVNDTTDPFTGNKATKPMKARVWVELVNTMVPPVPTTDPNYAAYQNQYKVQLMSPPGPTSYAIYQLLVRRPGASGSPVPGFNQTDGAPGSQPGPTGQIFNSSVTNPNPATGGAKGAVYNWTNNSVDVVDTAAPVSGYSGTSAGNRGFYVVGPPNATPGPNAADWASMPSTIQDNAMMSDDIPVSGMTDATIQQQYVPSVYLQRLLCPGLPPNNDATGNTGVYNPYVTVDYMEFTDSTGGYAYFNTGIKFDPSGPVPTQKPVSQRKAVGRKQPFAGQKELMVAQPTSSTASEPNNSFFRHNGPPASPTPPATWSAATGLEPFDWPVHLDRKLISPMELLQVSATSPFMLTQRFKYLDMTATPPVVHPFAHLAPWDDQGVTAPTSTRLYRALEFFRCGDKTVEMAFGGRDLGKININTIYDFETFNALCDAQTGNSFSGYDPNNPTKPYDVAYVWNAMMPATPPTYPPTVTPQLPNGLPNGVRTPYLNPPPTALPYSQVPYYQITQFDKPFWSLAGPVAAAGDSQYPATVGGTVPLYPTGVGVNLTLLRSGPPLPSTTPPPPPLITGNKERLFDSVFPVTPPATGQYQHPYVQKQLLTKIFNNVTTRSNVFAMYLTVGFFEVVDDSDRIANRGPVKLGREMNFQGAPIRKRMFAIVDRTNLTLDQQRYLPNSTTVLDPNDTAYRLRQGPKPYFYASDYPSPVTSQQLTSAQPYPNGYQFIDVTIPATGGLSSSNSSVPGYLTGSYEGTGWKIGARVPPYPSTVDPPTVRGTFLLIDVGGNTQGFSQEWVEVAAVNYNTTDPTKSTIKLAIPPVVGASTPTKTHPNGFLISNAELGNPGPQANFNFRDPRYQPVVLYSAILE
jgi:hypothetical protein